MNFAPVSLPTITAPLPKEVRLTILRHAHEFIQAWGTVRPAKEVVYTQLVPHLAAPLAHAYEILVDEAHVDLAGRLAFGQESLEGTADERMGKFRNLWVGTMIAKVFAKTPCGAEAGHWMEFFFDYEALDGPMAPKRAPWNDMHAFCEYMATRAIRFVTDGRLTGQALSHWGIQMSDLEGIEIPGYVPPDRDNPIVKPAASAVIAARGSSDFAMSLVLGVFDF